MLGFLLNVVLALLFLCLTTVSQAQSAQSAGCVEGAVAPTSASARGAPVGRAMAAVL